MVDVSACLTFRNTQPVLWYPSSWEVEAGRWVKVTLRYTASLGPVWIRETLSQTISCLKVFCFCGFFFFFEGSGVFVCLFCFVSCINFFLALKSSPCEQLLGRVTVQFRALVEIAVLVWLLLMHTLFYQIVFLPGCWEDKWLTDLNHPHLVFRSGKRGSRKQLMTMSLAGFALCRLVPSHQALLLLPV